MYGVVTYMYHHLPPKLPSFVGKYTMQDECLGLGFWTVSHGSPLSPGSGAFWKVSDSKSSAGRRKATRNLNENIFSSWHAILFAGKKQDSLKQKWLPL